jgi:hypothetical protein
MKKCLQCLALILIFCPQILHAQKIYLNPSDQTGNAVAGGGNEAQYALINAKNVKTILDSNGFTSKVDQDFYNSPYNAKSWGADIFVSVHSNAGGGHGTETLYKSDADKVLAGHVQDGLIANLPYTDRGLKYRDDLHVLNATAMTACLTEVVFHDCAAKSGYKGHPPSESDFLKSSDGQNKISKGISSGICTHYSKECDGTVLPPQKGWFKGVTYKYPDMNDRIPYATVTLNTGQSVVSSDTGYWEFELDPGTYTATAVKTGYYPNSSTRTVEAGKEVWGSIGLTPLAQSDDSDLFQPEITKSEDTGSAEEYSAEEYMEEIYEIIIPDLSEIKPEQNDIYESVTDSSAKDASEVDGAQTKSEGCTVSLLNSENSDTGLPGFLIIFPAVVILIFRAFYFRKSGL